ncbi:unnamed protein product [Triticum turgidum subsp. durum]|uniref:Uncharacterized protein n=1 Tax=Triticum turgidum subsp. durum TaxID=4567 RepID=A0A9R1AI01_TRITD|nr:unnamed protein product [Triticum turgidum subsp. durum]
MPMLIPDDVRAKAEIYTGDAAGQEKTRLMLAETELPSGLLPLKDIIECGYVEETGFVWLKQKKRVDHYFVKAGRHATDDLPVPVTGRLKKKTEKESTDKKDEKKEAAEKPKEEAAEKPKGASVAPAPAAVDEIGQKMKEMNTEAVAAKN